MLVIALELLGELFLRLFAEGSDLGLRGTAALLEHLFDQQGRVAVPKLVVVVDQGVLSICAVLVHYALSPCAHEAVTISCFESDFRFFGLIFLLIWVLNERIVIFADRLIAFKLLQLLTIKILQIANLT